MGQFGVILIAAWLLTTKAGALAATSDLPNDIERLAIECQRIWQFDAIIFIRSEWDARGLQSKSKQRSLSSDTPISARDIMLHEFQFQQVENTRELVAHFQHQTNLMAISLRPIDQDEIIKLISSGLLEKIHFFTELPTSTQLLDNAPLRLDSKYGHNNENIPNFKVRFLKIRLFLYERNTSQVALHEVYAIKGKISALWL